MAKKPTSIFIAGDSECTISVVECEDKILGTWFANHVAEVQDHFRDWEQQGIKVEKLHHWPGKENIADIATKGEATVKDIAFGSVWQNGPEVLRLAREHWPASREFTRAIPDEEKLSEFTSHVTGVAPSINPDFMVSDVAKVMDYSDDLDKVVSIFA